MKFSNTVKMSMVAVVIIIASLLVGYILGAIDSETAQSTGTKSILVIGVVALAFIALGAIAGNSRKND